MLADADGFEGMDDVVLALGEKDVPLAVCVICLEQETSGVIFISCLGQYVRHL